MSKKRGGDKDKDGLGEIISFPSGKSISPQDMGADYAIIPPSIFSNSYVEEPVDPEDLQKEFQEREEFVEKQKLVKSVQNNASVSEIIDQVLLEIAEELSHLKWERRKASKEGKSTVNHTVSRINCLGRISDILIKKKETAISEKLDLKSPRFQKILQSWMEFLYLAMQKSGIRDEDIDVVFNQMKADMVGWESKITDDILS